MGSWNKTKYNKLIAELHEGLGDAEEDIPDIDPGEIAYEVAESVLSMEKGLKEFIVNSIGALDYQGRLADDIYSGDTGL